MKKILFPLIAVFVLFSAATAQKKQDAVLKVLAIGNSFSADAVENYLFDLAKAGGKKILIGNMYIGGAPLSLHVKNADSNKAAYSYRKIYSNGEKKTTKNFRLEQAIKDEQWDYISLQQASPLSGQYEVIQKSLPALIAYVKSLAPQAKLIYHQTWAYQQNSTHAGFANYNKDQQNMYQQITGVAKKLNKTKDFAFIIPAGTAIQNGRTSSIGDHFTRDGYHLQLGYGRFTAACTWYEKLFNTDVRKNAYQPDSISATEARIAKEAAHKAAKKPFKVSQVRL